jgi:signal transduction histidine kinase
LTEPSYDVATGKFQAATSEPPPTGLALWLAVAGVGLVVGEATYQIRVANNPVFAWSWLAGVALVSGLVAAAAWRSRTRSGRGLAGGLGVLTVLLAVASLRNFSLTQEPDSARQAAVETALDTRGQTLASAVGAARQVARYARERVGEAAPGSAPRLDDLLSGGPIEMGVVVLGGDTVIAVAGPQRVDPEPQGSAATVVQDAFARVLVLTEQRGPRRVQVNLLLDASSALPAPGNTLAERSGRWQRVGWQWPTGVSVQRFDNAEDAITAITAAMRPVAPPLNVLRARELMLAHWLAIAGLAVLAAMVLTAGAPPLARAVALVLPTWVVARSGVLPDASGGAATTALVAGAGLLLVAVVLWQRAARRAPVGMVAAVILLGVAPPLVWRAAREIAPPVGPGTMLSWFGWQAVLALATAAYLAIASAPLRSREDEASDWRWGAIATALALLIGAVGIEAWTPTMQQNNANGLLLPAGHWPIWYTLGWLLPFAAMLPVTTLRARRVAVFTTAATLAALGAWDASLSQRMQLARADVTSLGIPNDSLTTPALDSLTLSIRSQRATRLAQVYALWHDSPVADSLIPTQLAVWRDTSVIESVALDSLAPTWGDLQQVVAGPGTGIRRVPLARGEGRHVVQVIPLSGDTIVTVMLGPRSNLVKPTRFGRMVDWRSTSDPAYTLGEVQREDALPDFTFRRTGRILRADQAVSAGGRPLIVRATVLIDPPQPFAVRAALTVLLDVLLVLLAWTVMERLLGLRHGDEARVFRRSYRRTMAAALISFFVVPAAFFTLWSGIQLRQEVARERGQEVDRALHDILDDPALTPDALSQPQSATLAQVADRVDAEVGVYRSGRLVAASAPLLAELGLLGPVVDPAIVRAGPAETGELAAPIPGANVRLGGQATPLTGTLVAAALPGAQAELEREQVNLALLLLLASLGGTLAAVTVAGAVARALGQPIEALRQRALAIGRRELAPPLRNPPAEFEAMFGAIAQMERDLGQSEARLEDETARTARIVAWGEMARQVAHEIKNPLTPMRLGLQHLKRLGADGRPDLPEQAAATAERLLEEIDRLDRIARSFARYGAPPEREAGPLEPVALDDVAGEIAELYRLGSSGLGVEVSGSGTVVEARREELIQVLLNLLDNAREAGATTIEVVLAGRTLTVVDNGRGIPEDQRERIFEPTFSTTTSGTGLGLAIVRRLVEGWGARVSAGAALGGGASFMLEFPSPGSTLPARET